MTRRLSACMIVRDEAAVLARCIASLREVVDEWCIVDTGSADDTVAIARAHGARTERFTDCNGGDGRIADFAIARDRALAMATGDWILQVDADEVLDSGAQRVRHWVGSDDLDSVVVRLRSGGSEWMSERLFRRAAATRYRSRVHEYLEHGGRAARDLDICLANRENKAGKESSSGRNRRLCELALADDPDDARMLFYLAGENREAGRLEEAAAQFARCLELGSFLPGRFRAAFQLGVCHLLLGRWAAAVEAARAAIALEPTYAEGHCLLADAYACMDRPALARPHYEAALACVPPQASFFPVERWAYDEHPRRRLRLIDEAAAR